MEDNLDRKADRQRPRRETARVTGKAVGTQESRLSSESGLVGLGTPPKPAIVTGDIAAKDSG